ncbi:uracil-DNA glycosylase [Acidobacteriota bacterium]
MEQKTEKLLDDIKERLSFFDLIGADFISSDPPSTSDSPSVDFDQRILSCKLCGLSQTRTHAVPGEGALDSDLMFVGEAPGRDEDLQGRPFVGRAGQLLTKIITAMKFDRSEVYITNILKCRPPQNRDPKKDEIESCQAYLYEQIEQIQPRVIVTLGKFAAEFFIPNFTSITAMRGKLQLYRHIPLMPTFHPSYLIRNEGNRQLKRMVWEDMKQVMAMLDRK